MDGRQEEKGEEDREAKGRGGRGRIERRERWRKDRRVGEEEDEGETKKAHLVTFRSALYLNEGTAS